MGRQGKDEEKVVNISIRSELACRLWRPLWARIDGGLTVWSWRSGSGGGSLSKSRGRADDGILSNNGGRTEILGAKEG